MDAERVGGQRDGRIEDGQHGVRMVLVRQLKREDSPATGGDADLDRFPCLGLAYEAIKRGGNAPCALNSANEVAVAAFLRGQIGFYDIARLCERALDGSDFVVDPSLDDIFATHEQTAEKIRAYIR